MGVRIVWALGMLVAVTAHADPVKRPASRLPPPDLTGLAYEAFVAGLTAERANDLAEAEAQYYHSIDATPTAEALWNTAQIQLALEEYSSAERSFRAYLALNPVPADHERVEKALADVLAIPARVIAYSTDLQPSQIFLDGVFIGPSPQVLHPAPGYHSIDRVTRTGFVHLDLRVEAHHPYKAELADAVAPASPVGNVVLSRTDALEQFAGWTWTLDGGETHDKVPIRLVIAPGKHALRVAMGAGKACQDIAIDVVKTAGVQFLYIDGTKGTTSTHDTCWNFTATSHQVALP